MLDLTIVDSFLKSLANQTTFQYFAPKETLFNQNDEATALFVVKTGRIRLVRHINGKKPRTIEMVGKGEFFGEFSLFDDTYPCTAIANVASCVIVCPKQPLLLAFGKDPNLTKDLTTILIRKIQRLNFRLELLNIRSAQERVLMYLRYLAGFTDETTIDLDRSLKDIAKDLDITPETLSRALSILAQKKMITRTNRSITLHHDQG